MILLKKSLLALAILLSTIVIAIILIYLARDTLVKRISEEPLSQYHAKITCLDFKVNTDLKLEVSRLCLQTPQADIHLDDMIITFDLAAKQKIKRIDISTANMQGTAELFTDLNASAPQNNHTTPAQQLASYLTQLTHINLPFNINIKELHYLPFTQKNNRKIEENISYSGKFSVIQNTIDFSLKDPQQTTLLTVKTSTKKQQLTADFTAQLKPLKRFLLVHNLPISKENLNTLASVEANGELHNVLNYQAGLLTVNSELKAFSLLAPQGYSTSGPFELTGALDFSSKIDLMADNQTMHNNGEFYVEFQESNTLQLQFSRQHLIDYLPNNSANLELIKLLSDNPVEQLTFKPNGTLTYNPNNQHLSLSGLSLTANSVQQSHQLNLEDIYLDLNYYLTGESALENIHNNTERINLSEKGQHSGPQNVNPQLAQLNFKLDSALLLSAISHVTDSPIMFNLQGSISQSKVQTTIKLDENSALTSNNIAISKKQKTADNKLLSIKQLITKIQGTIALKNHPQAQSKNTKQEQQTVNFNLIAHTQAKKLRVDQHIEIKTLAIATTVTGSLNDIKINAATTADNVALGNLVIKGALDKPNISLAANALQLTDLLALNIKLPQKVALVEGKLSYRVTGQITDLQNLQNTPLAISVAITSLSGEIADIWIQELNWQQNFQLLDGEMSSLGDSFENPTKNLTVALIDMPTPISKLSINTNWRYQKDFKISATELKGDILGGSFSIPKIQWPLEHGHSVDVQLTSIDLEQVLALDKKQGIVVTGKISGQLPIYYDGKKYTMEKGELHNVSNGLIQVINNPAVQELKASNAQLQLAFDALQNLHYHQLSSDVSMADDGYMLLETVIKGRNPDIDNDVNLNLNLNYDLLGLLESMSITEKFEQRIIKGLQKH